MKKLNLGKNVMVIAAVACTVALTAWMGFYEPVWKTEPLPEAPKLQEPVKHSQGKLKPYTGPGCKLASRDALNQVIREIDKHPEWKVARTQELIIYSLPECVGSWYEVNEVRNSLRYIGRIYKQRPSSIKDDVNSYVYSGHVYGYSPELVEPLFTEFGVENQPATIY